MFKFVALFAFVAVASAEIIYPCGETPNYTCVAAYMSEKAGCTTPIVPEPIGDLSRAFTIEVPFFKETIDVYDSSFTGVGDATITTLYVDTEAGKTVRTTKFPASTNYGREILQFHNAGEIDTELDTAFSITYTDIYVTYQWDSTDALVVGTARIYSTIAAASYELEADWPELYAEINNNPEGVIAQTLALGVENPTVVTGEASLYVGRTLGRLFTQTYICSNIQDLLDAYNASQA